MKTLNIWLEFMPLEEHRTTKIPVGGDERCRSKIICECLRAYDELGLIE